MFLHIPSKRCIKELNDQNTHCRRVSDGIYVDPVLSFVYANIVAPEPEANQHVSRKVDIMRHSS